MQGSSKILHQTCLCDRGPMARSLLLQHGGHGAGPGSGLCLGGRALVAEAGSWRFDWEKGGKGGKDWEKTGGFGGNMGKIWGTYGFFKSFLEEQMDFQNFFHGVGGKDRNPPRFYMFASNWCLETWVWVCNHMIQLGVKRCDTDWPVISLWTKHQVFFGIHCVGLTPNSWRKTAWNWSFPVFGRRYQGIN